MKFGQYVLENKLLDMAKEAFGDKYDEKKAKDMIEAMKKDKKSDEDIINAFKGMAAQTKK